MCSCENIGFGTYDNTVIVNGIQLDRCIAKEIQHLWSNGIKTIASCCGHNKVEPSVAVSKNSIPKMESLGYEQWINPMYPYSRDFFKLKSL